MWLEAEQETEGGEGEELKPALAGRVRHDVMKTHPYILALGRHLGLSRLAVGVLLVSVILA